MLYCLNLYFENVEQDGEVVKAVRTTILQYRLQRTECYYITPLSTYYRVLCSFISLFIYLLGLDRPIIFSHENVG
jgi:hypothetical protein